MVYSSEESQTFRYQFHFNSPRDKTSNIITRIVTETCLKLRLTTSPVIYLRVVTPHIIQKMTIVPFQLQVLTSDQFIQK